MQNSNGLSCRDNIEGRIRDEFLKLTPVFRDHAVNKRVLRVLYPLAAVLTDEAPRKLLLRGEQLRKDLVEVLFKSFRQ